MDSSKELYNTIANMLIDNEKINNNDMLTEEVNKIVSASVEMLKAKSDDNCNSQRQKEIVIESIYVNDQKLCADVTVNGVAKELYFEYSDNYKPEVRNADPFVIIMIRYAMINNYNIVSKVSVSPELLQSINRLLIPAIKLADPKYGNIKVTAPYYLNDSPLVLGAATGLSCGVDSFYTLLNHYKTGDLYFDVTHFRAFKESGELDNEMYSDNEKERLIIFMNDYEGYLSKEIFR